MGRSVQSRETSNSRITFTVQIDKILRSINNEKMARVDLQRQLDKLKGFSEDCAHDASAVHAKFTSWLDYAAAIRLACVSAEGTTFSLHQDSLPC